MFDRSIIAMIVAAFGSCLPSDSATRMPDHSICPDGVDIFAVAARVPSRYREIGLLSAKHAAREARGQRTHAAAMGANGIILTGALESADLPRRIGPAIGDGLDRAGKMVAIYIPSDSARVEGICRTALGSPRGPDAVASIGSAASAGPRARRRVSPLRRPPVAVRPFDLSGRPTRSARSLSSVPNPADSSIFMRNADVRSALATLERLHIVSAAEEVRPGLVRLSIAEMAPRAQLEYHLSFLHASYQAALPYGNEAVVELWSDGVKVGEYSNDGLVVTRSVAAER